MDPYVADIVLWVAELEVDWEDLSQQLNDVHAEIAHLHHHVETVKTWADDHVGRICNDMQTMTIEMIVFIEHTLTVTDKLRDDVKAMEDEVKRL
jgi:hypothetical protein